IGIAAGIAVGIGVGTWAALRLRKHLAAGVTGLLSAFFGTVAAVLVLWVVEVKLDAITGQDSGEWLGRGSAAGAAMLAAVGVRFCIARFRGSDWDEPPPSN
ncbi:MAG: hypothetical protein KY391_07335, partial [Actinobacteria bacterium]|nr:hypothetical protein [Actinomycetota bacterium]